MKIIYSRKKTLTTTTAEKWPFNSIFPELLRHCYFFKRLNAHSCYAYLRNFAMVIFYLSAFTQALLLMKTQVLKHKLNRMYCFKHRHIYLKWRPKITDFYYRWYKKILKLLGNCSQTHIDVLLRTSARCSLGKYLKKR